MQHLVTHPNIYSYLNNNNNAEIKAWMSIYVSWFYAGDLTNPEINLHSMLDICKYVFKFSKINSVLQGLKWVMAGKSADRPT